MGCIADFFFKLRLPCRHKKGRRHCCRSRRKHGSANAAASDAPLGDPTPAVRRFCVRHWRGVRVRTGGPTSTLSPEAKSPTVYGPNEKHNYDTSFSGHDGKPADAQSPLATGQPGPWAKKDDMGGDEEEDDNEVYESPNEKGYAASKDHHGGEESEEQARRRKMAEARKRQEEHARANPEEQERLDSLQMM